MDKPLIFGYRICVCKGASKLEKLSGPQGCRPSSEVGIIGKSVILFKLNCDRKFPVNQGTIQSFSASKKRLITCP